MFTFDGSNRNLHLIFDCDDVLLDWMGGFRSWVSWLLPFAQIDPAGPADWDMSDWLGLSQERTRELVVEFNATQRFGRLDARYDALMQLPVLHKMGHRLTVLTSCSADPITVERRKENLRFHFGDIFQQIICLPLGESKKKWLNILDRGIWIEDNYGNAVAGHDCGHRTFLLRRRHNRSHERSGDALVTWIDDLRPIVSLLS